MGLKVITKEEEERRIIETAKEILSGCQEYFEFEDDDSSQVKVDGWFTLAELEAICALKRKAQAGCAYGLAEDVDATYS